MSVHTDKQYEEELGELKNLILKAGGTVEEMIVRSIQAMVERDNHMAQQVLARDREVNDLEIAIDDLCLQLLALRQPAASDLRFIAIGLKASKDLERMGDLAVNIAEQALALNRAPQLKPYIDLPKMAAETQKMVAQALDAFVKRDASLAKLVCETDDVVDSLNDQVFEELVGLMQRDSTAPDLSSWPVIWNESPIMPPTSPKR